MAIPKSLATITQKMQKKYGEERVLIASEGLPEVECFSTGSHLLDLAIRTENGGFPVGRMVEIYGPEAAGKTTVCLLAIAEIQKEELRKAELNPKYEEKLCMFLDAEHTFDKNTAVQYGIDLDRLIYINSNTAEESLDIFEGYIRSGLIRLAVVDSVPALTPSRIEESSMSDATIGLQARLMSTICMKLNGVLAENKTTVLWINQIRDKIGGYGNPETTPGGRALKFYSSLRLKVSRAEDIKSGDDCIGHVLKVNVVKNKTGGLPKRVASTSLLYGKGYSRENEIFNVALQIGVIVRAGAWYSLIDSDTGEIMTISGITCKFQGGNRVVEAMEEYPEIYEEVLARVNNFGVEMEEEDIEED